MSLADLPDLGPEVLAELLDETWAERIRGKCPQCRAAVVSALVYVDGRGYLIIWRCSHDGCDWRRVL